MADGIPAFGTRVEVLFADGDRHKVKPKWHGGVVRKQILQSKLSIELDPGVCKRRNRFQKWLSPQDIKMLHPKDGIHFYRWTSQTTFKLHEVDLWRVRVDASEHPDNHTVKARTEFLAKILDERQSKHARERKRTCITWMSRLPFMAMIPLGAYLHANGMNPLHEFTGGFGTTVCLVGLVTLFAMSIYLTALSRSSWGQQGRTGGPPIQSYVISGFLMLTLYTIGSLLGDILGSISSFLS